jgi:two-component system NtrC family sensor kinase
LIQAEKMAAVGRLVASLAHEINNPLQSVRNCVHLATRSDIDEDQRSSYLAMTESEVERLVNTVRQMLDFYRPGPIEKEPVDLGEVVDRVAGLVRSQMKSTNVDFEVNIPAKVPQVFGVKDQLQQVLFNLILNGMDAVENQPVKKIWLEMSPVNNQEVNIVIEDSGPGIDAEIRERIFEPFISTKKNGTGLGLSISFSIIEGHGGRLRVIPGKHGQGACFEICLPIRKKV